MVLTVHELTRGPDGSRAAAPAPETSCPACGRPGAPFRSASDIADDLRLAAQWSAAQWSAAQRHGDPAPARRSVHGDAMPVLACPTCGTLWRAAPGVRRAAPGRSRADRSSPRQLRDLHRREYARARHDLGWYRDHGVTAGQRVLEVGAHVGAFLRLAAEQGCDAYGVDVGTDTTAFCRRLGLRVARGDIRAAERGPDVDSVWILSCFDRLPDPLDTLRRAHDLLVPGGRLVIHAPDAAAVHDAYLLGGTHLLTALDEHLWGVPFLACYSRRALRSLVVRAGFGEITQRRRRYGSGDGAGWFDTVARRPR